MTQIERITAKGQLVPLIFSQDATADSQTAAAMNIIETGATSGTLGTQEYQVPFDFEFIAVSVVSDSARTAGTLTVDATKNGTVTGLQAALDATNTTRHYAKQARDSDKGVAGDRIGVKLTTASWTPVTADIVVVVWALVYVAGV
tara:strand:- start:249 stop:683 length:435 start_codon:yes stop_codon:yes gene_type:complete